MSGQRLRNKWQPTVFWMLCVASCPLCWCTVTTRLPELHRRLLKLAFVLKQMSDVPAMPCPH